MRITLIIPFSIDRPSGIRYFNIARSLTRRGHHVRILGLHPDFRSCVERRFVQDGVEIWYLGQMHARKGGAGPDRFGPLELLLVLIRATLGLVWGILCSPSDVYHLGKPQPVNGLAGLIGAGLLRRQGFYVDCDDDETTSNRFTARWQRSIFAFWQWLIPRLARGVTVNTRFLEARMDRAGIAPVVYVPNGVDPDRFAQPPARAVAGLRAGLDLAGKRAIVYLGSLALQNHPVDLLLQAFAPIAAARPDVVLLIVGGGEDLALLREQAAEAGLAARVRFAGRVPQIAAPAYLALAEVTVDPVRDDPVARARSPLKLFESMALGVPVITGAVGDRAELLDHGRAGLLVGAGDANALAERLRAVLEDPKLRRGLAEAGWRQVRGYYWDVLAARWESTYNGAAVRRPL